ncbi:MAG: hypothetical protein LC737_06750, partial [Chloroflexi bacterium]|nr:hypothetical protein [Chloroflexota bacterium]
MQVRNLEHPNDTADGRGDFQAGESRALTLWIPWCTSADQFADRHLTVQVNGHTLAIWQANLGGADCVRMSLDGNWSIPGNEINGVSVVGPTIPNPVNPFDNPNRTLIINDSGLFLLPQVVVDALRNHHNDLAKGGYQICAEAPHMQQLQRLPD